MVAIFIELPVKAFPWNGCINQINPLEKMDYVNINWWDNFSDACLKYYIIKAIENNHDARKASWRVEEYRQMVKLQFSQELPSLSVGTTYILNHLPDTIRNTKNNIFDVPFLASYEADIFLKNHDKTKSSKKACVVTKFQEQSIYLSLASDVATTYINIIKYDKQIQLQEKIVELRKEALDRESKKYERGTTSVPKLNEYKKAYKNACSELNDLVKTRDKALNQFAVLIGESPENTASIERNSFDSLCYKTNIPSEIPSEVIFSRPDILAAEANLEKAKIDVKVARKEFLPTFNITGIYAFNNLGSAGFGSWGSTVAALVAGATLDLFKGGWKVANLKVYRAKYEQLFEEYKQVDLNALKEVNDSLLIVKEDTKIYSNINSNFNIQEDNYKRAEQSYKQGTISYQEMLSSKEQLLSQEQNKTSSRAVCFIDYITLYKAVGGEL